MSYCYNCFCKCSGNTIPCPHCGYDPATDQGKYPFALHHGSILAGRYITGRVLGQGGFGITYLALDNQSKARVAIKEFMPDSMAVRTTGTPQITVYSGQRQENFQYGMERFLDEARTLAKFQGNPSIVGVQSYFEENGTAYFVMEYVEGVSFKSYIHDQGGKIPWEEAVRILLPVMEALDAVHKEGIIHRDVTPDNIFLTKDGSVRLLDFGSARYSLGDKSRSLDVVLKAGYAPKEQYTRRGRQGPYTDVYSLAACFYSAITGYLPPESLDRADEDDLVLPSTRGIPIPQEVEDVILHGLEVQPADRYQTMGEFRDALVAALAETMKEAEPEPAPIPEPELMPDHKPKLTPEPEPIPEQEPELIPEPIPGSKPKRRVPKWVWGVGVACVAAVLALFVFSAGPKVSFAGRTYSQRTTEIDAPFSSIKDISPLENLTNLTVLYLGFNNISDISPLESLTNLTKLFLQENSISDISPIANLMNLTDLYLDSNNISDIEPLKSLTNLERVDLTGNPISQEQIDTLRRALPNCEITF